MSSQSSQFFAVALASGLFGYWLAVGMSLGGITRNTSPRLQVDQTGDHPESSSSAPQIAKSDKKKKKKNGNSNQHLPSAADTIEEVDVGSDTEDERSATQSRLDTVSARRDEECKLVLVVNQELGMAKGKIAAQCGHATLACYKTLQSTNPKLLKHWEITGQAKVAVKCSSTQELLELQKRAKALNLCARAIQDAGRTQVQAGSRTVLGIGPGPVKLINQVTGHLKLL